MSYNTQYANTGSLLSRALEAAEAAYEAAKSNPATAGEFIAKAVKAIAAADETIEKKMNWAGKLMIVRVEEKDALEEANWLLREAHDFFINHQVA